MRFCALSTVIKQAELKDKVVVFREVYMNSNNPDVSVLCTAYNHEKYIRKCLDGFVMQKTDFKFEVIVHDDASTDNTAEIIREYERKYPEIIKPIYQTVNQFSKKVPIIKKYMLPKAEGKYIALCEGDDFWTDKLKLQKQFDALEANENCNLCVCTVRDANEDGTPMKTTHPSKRFESCVFDTQEFLKVALKEYAFQTSSYFLRKETYADFFYNPPEYKLIAPVGDWPTLLYCTQKGGIYYINDEMSCYRRNAIGSLTTDMKDANVIKQKKYYSGMIDMIESFDQCTDMKYHEECELFRIRFQKYYYDCLKSERNFKDVLNKKYRSFFRQESFKDKLYIRVSVYCPFITKLYNKIRHSE